jgi:hypothetical protein
MTRASPALVLTLGGLLVAGGARADDWLVSYPECGLRALPRRASSMALLYPRADLAAVVAQGDLLVTRVQVPTGLTPPPGIQQSRALHGWDAELVGHGLALDGAQFRYAVRVVDVRADGASTLIYRAAIRLPAWIAPGVYSLRLAAPGGVDVAVAAVRVIDRGHEPRVAVVRVPSDLDAAAIATLVDRLSPLDVDVWLLLGAGATVARLLQHRPIPASGPAAPLPAVVVWSSAVAASVVLRAEGSLWSFGGCHPPALSDGSRDALAAQQGLPFRQFDETEAEPAAAHATWLSGDGGFALPEADANMIARTSAGVALRGAATVPVRVNVALPLDGRRIDGASAVWPAINLHPTSAPPAIVVAMRAEPARSVVLARGTASAFEPTAVAHPRRTESGQRVRIAIDADRPLSMTAWELGDDVTSVGPAVEHAFMGAGQHEVHAWVVARDGAAARLAIPVDVDIWVAQGCSGVGPLRASWPQVLCWLAFLLRLGAPLRGRLRGRRGTRP